MNRWGACLCMCAGIIVLNLVGQQLPVEWQNTFSFAAGQITLLLYVLCRTGRGLP